MANSENIGGYSANSDNSKKQRKIFIILLIILALLSVVFLYQYIKTNKELKSHKEQLDVNEGIRFELELELEKIRVELKDYEGQVEEMDSLMILKNTELLEKAEEIEKLLNEKNLTTNQLRNARKELDALRYYTRKYTTQIDSLNKVNERLKTQNIQLSQNLDNQKLRTDKLMDENVRLSNKVVLGSQLNITELEVVGVRSSNIGDRERTTNRAGRMERLRICFTLEDNIIADPGEREVFVRIQDPQGSTIHVEDAGSGKFIFRGDETLYTTKMIIDYQNVETDYCLYWDHSTSLRSGDYKIEVYAESALIGSSDLRIR